MMSSSTMTSHRSLATVLGLIAFFQLFRPTISVPFSCDGREWEIRNEYATWNEAEADCQSWGSHLLTVRNRGDYNCLRNVSIPEGEFRWIGLNDKAREGNFTWSSGYRSAIPKSWWKPGQPDNHLDGEHCAAITTRGSVKTFNDLPCTLPYGYICDVRQCPSGWRQVGRKCWHLQQARHDYFGGIKECERNDSTLAVPENRLEDDILGNMTRGSVWTGVYNPGSGISRSARLEMISYNGFRQPYTIGNIGNSNCVIKSAVGDRFWHTETCDHRLHRVVCEKAPVDGSWSSWSRYSECSATCGICQQIRRRTCTNPIPQYGGRLCNGPASKSIFSTRPTCAAIPHANCPADWISGRSKCYLWLYGAWKWDTARSLCAHAGHGTRLLSVNSREEQSEVNSIIHRHGAYLWLDMRFNQTTGKWLSNAVAVPYSHWLPGGRINYHLKCAVSSPRGGQWNSTRCTARYTAVCERDLVQCSEWSPWSNCTVSCGRGTRSRSRQCGDVKEPDWDWCTGNQCPALAGERCPIGWTAGIFKCYQAQDGLMPWAKAQNQCQSLGNFSNLLSINSSDERDDMTHTVLPSYGRLWLARFRNGRRGVICARVRYDADRVWVYVYCTINAFAVCERDFVQCSEWSSWSSCSRTCGRGKRTRGRLCNGDIDDGWEWCDSSPCPGEPASNCPMGWIVGQLKCYQQQANHYSWTAAHNVCNSAGGCMLFMKSAEERREATILLDTDEPMWLDLTYSRNESRWVKGRDQTAVEYFNWGREPNGRLHANCGLTGYNSEQWYGRSCLHEHRVVCERSLQCPSLWAPTNGSMNGAGRDVNATITFGCDRGFRLMSQSSRSRTCQANLQWSGEPAACSPLCRQLQHPYNGAMISEEGEDGILHAGITKTFTCNEGYVLSNLSSAERTCQLSGQWTGTDAYCVPTPVQLVICGGIGFCSSPLVSGDQLADTTVEAACPRLDIAFIARVGNNTTELLSMPGCLEHRVLYRVVTDVHRTANCPFLPNSGDGYDAIIANKVGTDREECRMRDSDATYLITATCDRRRSEVVFHSESLFVEVDSDTRQATINRLRTICQLQ